MLCTCFCGTGGYSGSIYNAVVMCVCLHVVYNLHYVVYCQGAVCVRVCAHSTSLNNRQGVVNVNNTHATSLEAFCVELITCHSLG